MPGFLVHVNAQVTCSHAGQALPTAPVPRVLVMGQPVVTRACPYTVAGCTLPPPPAANGPCVTAQWITSATRVFAMGVPVLLQDSQSICAPTGTPLLIVMTQTRVLGM
jgi:hypothetical protein